MELLKLKKIKLKMLKIKHLRNKLKAAPLVVLGTCMVFGIAISPVVDADQYTQQIQTLQQANGAAQETINSLAAQATSYQAALSELQNQMAVSKVRLVLLKPKYPQLRVKFKPIKSNLPRKNRLSMKL
jgi:hypothetical protein